MNHDTFVIFLLIVSGTIATLGSPIKEDYPEEYPELSPNGKELDTFRLDPADMGNYPEMAPNHKELEAVLRSDPELGNYPEMIPNYKELEALRMRSNQSNSMKEKDTEMSSENQERKGMISSSSNQDNQKVKRVDAAKLIPVAQLTLNLLNSFASGGSYSRMITIGIANESGHKWTAINTYFYSGTSDEVLASPVPSGNAEVYTVRKTSFSFYGVAGVLAYYIKTVDKTLAIMFYNPFWGNNYWNIKIYSGKEKADKKMYNTLYSKNAIKGDNDWHEGDLEKELGLKYNGFMSSSNKAAFEVKVHAC